MRGLEKEREEVRGMGAEWRYHGKKYSICTSWSQKEKEKGFGDLVGLLQGGDIRVVQYGQKAVCSYSENAII